MRGTQGSSFSRLRIVAGLAAAVLGIATCLTAAPATAAPSPSPSPSPAPTAKSSGSTADAPTDIVCTKGPNGHPVNCPSALPVSKLPASAKNQAMVAQPVTDPAQLVDTRTWT